MVIFVFSYFNSKMDNKLVIAIDGYSSCGKSTFAKAVAQAMNYAYIDSGAMYRAVTLAFMRNGMIENHQVNKQGIIEKLNEIEISFSYNPLNKKNETWLNGENIEEEIREIKVSENVSPVSKIKEVREKLVSLQRKMGEQKGIVMDGRDIGTVVFPMADLKIFMTADKNIRAERRYKELIGKGLSISFEEVRRNLEQRDFMDENRKESPLKKAEDAIVLDNSHLTPEEELEWILQIINSKYPC